MNIKNYPVTSGKVVVKYGSFETNKYYVKDMKTKRSGFANADMIELLKLCDGLNDIQTTIKILTKKYDGNIEKTKNKVLKSLNYFRKMGYLKFSTKQKYRPIIFHKKKYKWPLDVVYLEITHKCNLYCIHCYADAGRKFKYEMSKKQILKLINGLTKMGVLEIIVTGGEPLVRKDLFDILEYIVEKNMNFSLFTNGILLNKESVLKLKKLDPDTIAVSMDGYNSNTHDKIRGKGSFSRTLKNVKMLVNENLPVRINVTLLRGLNDNKKQIEKMFDFLIKNGIRNVAIGCMIEYGRGKEKKYYTPNFRVAKLVSDTFKNKTIKVDKRQKDISLNFSDDFTAKGDKDFLKHSFCGVGVFACTIRASGDVILCPVLSDEEHKAGNIFKQSLEQMWLKSNVFKNLRGHTFDDIKECKKCRHKHECLSGCKARSLMYNSDFRSPDLWMCASYNKRL